MEATESPETCLKYYDDIQDAESPNPVRVMLDLLPLHLHARPRILRHPPHIRPRAHRPSKLTSPPDYLETPYIRPATNGQDREGDRGTLPAAGHLLQRPRGLGRARRPVLVM